MQSPVGVPANGAPTSTWVPTRPRRRSSSSGPCPRSCRGGTSRRRATCRRGRGSRLRCGTRSVRRRRRDRLGGVRGGRRRRELGSRRARGLERRASQRVLVRRGRWALRPLGPQQRWSTQPSAGAPRWRGSARPQEDAEADSQKRPPATESTTGAPRGVRIREGALEKLGERSVVVASTSSGPVSARSRGRRRCARNGVAAATLTPAGAPVRRRAGASDGGGGIPDEGAGGIAAPGGTADARGAGSIRRTQGGVAGAGGAGTRSLGCGGVASGGGQRGRRGHVAARVTRTGAGGGIPTQAGGGSPTPSGRGAQRHRQGAAVEAPFGRPWPAWRRRPEELRRCPKDRRRRGGGYPRARTPSARRRPT